MSLKDIFSKRQKKLKGELPDILKYDVIPQNLRVQIVHILRDCIGETRITAYEFNKAAEIYKSIFDILCREYGRFSLVKEDYDDNFEKQVLNFILQTDITEEILDTIEVAFQAMEIGIGNEFHYYQNTVYGVKTPYSAGIHELNERFKENGIGYSYAGGEIIKIDSTFVHKEIVLPAIFLLKDSRFKGANDEYLKAHEHYRHGRNKECLNECLKSFESTLKVICKTKNWKFNQTDTSRRLIQICFENELIPTYAQNQFTSLKNLLESGIPTLRNKLGGHGQGQNVSNVSETIARYGLNLTGTNIIFLVEQSKI